MNSSSNQSDVPNDYVPGASTSSVTTPGRESQPSSTRVYVWLLLLSTLAAVTFGLLYITKPVIVSSPNGADVQTPTLLANGGGPSPGNAKDGLMPTKGKLPGDSNASNGSTGAAIKPGPRTLPPPPTRSNLEETNLRIQHILTAETPGGHMDRIVVDVPVLYQSRNLRWTVKECDEARTLMTKLMDYQDKTLQLRIEGAELLDAWNRLIAKSAPVSELRADSPTLPANQLDSAEPANPSGLSTNESIQLGTPQK